MAGPHPVIDLAAEIADGQGRGINQAKIQQPSGFKEIVFIPAVHGFHVAAEVFSLPFRFRRQLFLDSIDGFVSLFGGQTGL